MNDVANGAVPDVPENEGINEDQRLPPLREDLRLNPAARSWDGERTWTIYDPVKGRFFQIGQTDFHLLGAWHLCRTGDILDEAARTSGRTIDIEDLNDLLEFLISSELLEVTRSALRQRLARIAALRQKGPLDTLLHNYLFIRIPLVRPDAFLELLYRPMRWLMRRWFLFSSLFAGVIGFVIVIRNWHLFTSSGRWLITPEGLMVFGITLVIVKVIHELGHALMCRHYGLRVPTMGIAFLVMWPVLYTDASESWRLTSRRQRAFISAAGVLTELCLAGYALFLWGFLPDGVARAVAFTVATTALVTSVLVNLNPLMRFDGYYFLSDLVGFPNLQDRSIAMAKWRLRKFLFDTSEPPPELLSSAMHRFAIGYAFAMLIYRFFLFVGIALLVYHFFFKALGVFLFLVEIWWFILRPILNELREWGGHMIAMPRRTRVIWLSTTALLALVILFPWRSDIALPAVLSPEGYFRVYPPKPAMIEAVHVTDGDKVVAGQPLISLRSPDLEYAKVLARSDLERLQHLRNQAQASEAYIERRLVLEQQYIRAQAEAEAVSRELSQLIITAPFDGVVRDLNPELGAGRWLEISTQLMTVVDSSAFTVIAWANEEQIQALKKGNAGLFYADLSSDRLTVPVTITRLGKSAVEYLDPPYHASVFAGEIAATASQGGHFRPEESMFQVSAVAQQGADLEGGGEVFWRRRGELVAEGERSSLLVDGIRRTVAALIRESGF